MFYSCFTENRLFCTINSDHIFLSNNTYFYLILQRQIILEVAFEEQMERVPLKL